MAEILTPLTNQSVSFLSFHHLWLLFFLCWVLVTHTIFSQSLWQYFFSSKSLNPYLHDNLCFTRQLSLICLLCISHEPMSLYTALCSTLLLRLFQDPDNVFRIFNQVYSGSKTLHISTCQIYNYVVFLVSINLDYYPGQFVGDFVIEVLATRLFWDRGDSYTGFSLAVFSWKI